MEQDRISRAGIAAVLSFVFNGLGQLYNGQIFKGLGIIFLSAISMLVLIIGAILFGFWLIGKVIFSGQALLGISLFFMGLVLVCLLGIYSIADAYRLAAKK